MQKNSYLHNLVNHAVHEHPRNQGLEGQVAAAGERLVHGLGVRAQSGALGPVIHCGAQALDRLADSQVSLG